MQGSGFGSIFHVTSWGESHGKAIGVVIDGVPAGLALCENDIQPFLNRRKPGQSQYTTSRQEEDRVEILSGVFEGKSTGTPISMIVWNQDQRSKDYDAIKDMYRPGHADYTYDMKYGFRDYRGGGRSSARETITRVCGGAVATKLLQELGITFFTYLKSVGDIVCDEIDKEEVWKNPLYMPDKKQAANAMQLIDECMKQKDSIGSVVECIISGVPAGLGEPVFQKLDASFASALMSINAVKAVEIGEGIMAARMKGSQMNDPFVIKHHKIQKETNHAGGILGGISDGHDIILRASIKPTPSIAMEQKTIKNGMETSISIHGRHDPIIGPRAVVVVEAMAAVTLVDALLAHMTSNMEFIKTIYKKDSI